RTFKSEDVGGGGYVPTSKAKQLEARACVNEQLFISPKWLLDPAVVNKTVSPEDPDFVGDLQQRVINTLLDSSTFSRLTANIGQFGTAKALSLEEYIGALHKYI